VKIIKVQPDQEGIIHIPNCVKIMNMGLKGDIVTMWAVTDILSKAPNMTFAIKKDGDSVTATDCKYYIASFINDKITYHLFGEEPKIKTAPSGLPNLGGK
jgi:hypothetical protein